MVKEIGERRGWGTSLANKQIEPVTTCPLTLTEAFNTLNTEELAVFFALFPEKLKAWRYKAYEKHTQLIADYRARVQKHYADAKEAKKNAGTGHTAAVSFVDWEVDPSGDDDDEVLCRGVSGGSDREASMAAELAALREQVVALTARVDSGTGSSDEGSATQLPTSPRRSRLSEEERLGLRRLIADDFGDGVTEDDILGRATDLGLAGLLE